ncbi:RIO1 family regulatory kinase/ATPase [Microbacterium sp.]|uniref:RIO1 family regulatory kinase/ATPase domain-containing protein n=1 Tax=Microbacterium sp. TaxID=51671 RepID=UPI0025F4A9C4|nr:RIO1 family regulatory kinase/ATPase [Microbacterium sp.]
MTDPLASFDALELSLTFADVEPGEGQRWTTWPATIPTQRGPQPWPAWIVTDAGALDTELGILKTGKEAYVFLLERAVPDDPGQRTLLAAKRYRGEETRSFQRSTVYTEGRGVQNTRDARALAKKSSHGREVTEILMEFIGDASGAAAPRLAQVRTSREELAGYFAQIAELMRVFAAAGFAHGDLSAYNLLVHEGRVRVIDLPQIVDIIANPQGLDLLHRDCVNVCDWFTRQRVECDAEELFAELLAASFA